MRANRIGRRRAVCEYLEPRYVLSTAPVVTAVEVGSTEWDSAFYDYLSDNSLGNHGFALSDGADQLETLPWNNIDRLSVVFDQDVDIDANDLALTGVGTAQYAINDFFYDPQTRTATWTLSQPLGEERLLIDLNADGQDPITSLTGDRLDGEWQDGVSEFASGNGVAGGDFELTLLTNPGDADRLGWVDYFDYVFVYYSGGLSTADAAYDPAYDIDGSGLIDATDYLAVFAELGGQPPTGDPAGAGNGAPTAQAAAHLDVDDDTVDASLSLDELFEDAEDPDSSLIYTILSNDAPMLFDSAAISQSTGELVVNAAAGASGRATIIVQAEDTSGLTTTTTITIDVDYDNAAPDISMFYASPQGADVWIIQGYVADADDDPTGWLVDITGVIETRAAVWVDGWFVFAVIVDPSNYGVIQATVADSHGATDTAFAEIGYS